MIDAPLVLSASVAAACLTLAAVHFSTWARDRAATVHLAFALLSVGVAPFTWASLAMMKATTPDAFAIALWWTNVAVLWLVFGCVAFTRLYFDRSRAWLGYLACGLRSIAMIAHVSRFPSSDFDTITSLETVRFLGQPVTVASGESSTWFVVGLLGLAVLFIFLIDAAVTAWRHGSASQRRRALAVGVPTALFVGGGAVSAGLIFTGVVKWPHVEFVPFLAVLAAMAFELSGDAIRAGRLSEQLRATQEALHDSERRITMSVGRLINAQEDERRRLARELHDDFNQRLALLNVELSLLGRMQTGRTGEGFARLSTQICDLSSELHKLSYQLHPARLEFLGLAKAMRALCQDVMSQHQLRIDFVSDGVPDDLHPDTALSLYRIAQEALRNAVRHSGADNVNVELTGDDALVTLVISDGGRGFDPATAASGLGLLSMRERASLANGVIEVVSAPAAGTVITVRVPLASPALVGSL